MEVSTDSTVQTSNMYNYLDPSYYSHMLSGLQEMFQADDRYYKSHGYYENNY